ncbi:hypothetical protein BFP72_08425 [Reichenbachiella sp. 5M10]|nr:hypothetical protein BFP72_08425 [Reichenbachiella sp. 5M10]
MKKIFFLLTMIFAMATSTQAQEREIALSYSVAIPLGDVGDYISNVSPRGVYFNYNHYFYDNIAVGLSAGLTTFYEEKADDTYVTSNGSISGKQFRYSNHVPLMVTGSYYLSTDGQLKPFVQLGLGTMYTRRDTDMGLYSIEEEAWAFALSPEVGLKYEILSGKSILLSAKYLNGFKAGDELDASQSFLAFSIGITL